MSRAAIALVAFSFAGLAAPVAAQPEDEAALARMPVKEVTVFKDGHAFVVHQGRMPTNAEGRVVLDGLPVPVLGTFWPYSAEREPRLLSVTAGRRQVREEQTTLSVRELIEANPGALVDLVDLEGKSFSGRIRILHRQPADAPDRNAPAAPRDLQPAGSGVLLLEASEGMIALPFDRIRTVNFKAPPATRLSNERSRDVLTLAFAWPDGKPRRDVEVGMAYVQKGLRWIPSYRVSIDGAGRARVQLQATLINELADLKDVTANLVVGVPSFAFRDAVDPIALQDTVARLGAYFDTGSATPLALSNAIMSQTAGVAAGGRFRQEGGAGAHAEAAESRLDLGPEVAGGEKEEDLFVFTVNRVTLRKGERMVLPVIEADLRYRDVYTLELPFAPPPEVRANANDQQQRELARLLGSPRVAHVLRLANSAREPLTTAPALIVSGDRVLGQGLMTYTAPGAECDLRLTDAVDLKVTKADTETGRTPNAINVNGSAYLRVNLAGRVGVTNRRGQAVDLEITRWVLGHADSAGQGGAVEMVNAYEAASGVEQPPWWGWYGWPGWWGAVNGVGRISWKVRVDAGQVVTLDYAWHYFWR